MLITTQDHGLWHRMHHKFFIGMYQRNLLYNTCWEDPRLDREAMKLKNYSEVLVITSAGCNALDYALDGPRTIYAIDANPRQNALLDLKLAGIRSLEYEDYFELFGNGRHDRAEYLYKEALRPQLTVTAQKYWDKSWRWFAHDKRSTRSFYYHGLSGKIARLITLMMRARQELWRWICALMECRTLDEQRYIFSNYIENRVISKPMSWTLNSQMTMNMLGVPYPQRQAVKAEHSDGIVGFIRSCLRAVCMDMPFWDNYFWTVYLRGKYTPDNCPNYLKPEGFEALKNGRADCIQTHTSTLTDFLNQRKNHIDISHFVLLDHMDWMADSFPQALVEEWQAIGRCARSHAQILFRSGAKDPVFLDSCKIEGPNCTTSLREKLYFDRGLADRLHPHDRVHTYASFHIARLLM